MALLAVTLCCLATVGLYQVFVVQSRLRDAELRAERAGYTREDFVQHFAAVGVRGEVSSLVYQNLQPWSPSCDIPILPADLLEDHFGMVVHEEIDDILKACYCREPTREEWGEANTLTRVDEMVHLVDRLYTGMPQTWPAWYQLPWTPAARIFGLAMLVVLIQIVAGGVVRLAGWLFGVNTDRISIWFSIVTAAGIGYCVVYAMYQLHSDRSGREYLISRGFGIIGLAVGATGAAFLYGLVVSLPGVMSHLGLLVWIALVIPFELLVFILVARAIEHRNGS